MDKVTIIPTSGIGTRLWPTTKVLSKPLLPVYDKPMIYYSLGLAIAIGSTEIIVMVDPKYYYDYQNLLGIPSENKFGIPLRYVLQKDPRGMMEAFILSEKYIKDKRVCLLPSDNIHYDCNFKWPTINVAKFHTVESRTPQDFGVVTFSGGKIVSLEEKPNNPKSKYIITSPIFFPGDSSEKAKKLSLSKRGELELIDLCNLYLEEDRLRYQYHESGFTDVGNPWGILNASDFVMGNKYFPPEKQWFHYPEIAAYRKGLIDKNSIEYSISKMPECMYKERVKLLYEQTSL